MDPLSLDCSVPELQLQTCTEDCTWLYMNYGDPNSDSHNYTTSTYCLPQPSFCILTSSLLLVVALFVFANALEIRDVSEAL